MKNDKVKNLARILNISESRSHEAYLKSKMIGKILEELKRLQWTHEQLANAASLSRSSVTGILNGSLQKVTIDRLLKLVQAVGLVPEIRFKKEAIEA